MYNLVIAYENLRFAKLYCPYPKRFWHLGNRDKDIVFGHQQILGRAVRSKDKKIGSTILLLGGEKDVLTATALGFDAVCLNSETANIPNSFVEFLEMYERVIVVYDTDATGKQRANQLIQMYEDRLRISAYNLPNELQENGGKDISDYVRLGLSKEKLIQEIAEVGKTAMVKRIDPIAEVIVTEETANYIKDDSDDSFLPIDTFENLPEILKYITEQFTDRRDKDLVLLSSLGVISSLLPTVKGNYGGCRVGCNLYLLVSAPAASGKGAMSWARTLGAQIQKILAAKFGDDCRAYQIATTAYRKEVKSNPSLLPPIEPKQRTLFIPANTSVSKIIELLGANKGFGVLFETEADTLANALSSEWGDFSDVLRKTFHHESVSLARRGNNEFIEVEKPHLSVVLSGTPNQIKNLMGSVENGFFSRFMFYDFKSEAEWIDPFISRDNHREQVFQEISNIFAEIWADQQDQNETIIYLSNSQRKRWNAYFENKLQVLLAQYGDGIKANVIRMGLICYRLAMILTALRSLEKNRVLVEEIEVQDVDFLIALSIVETVFISLERVYSRLQNVVLASKMSKPQLALFEALPKEYSREEYNSILVKMNYNNKTGEKYIRDFKKLGVIESVKHGYYRKVA